MTQEKTEFGGIYFDAATPDKVRSLILSNMGTERRLRIYLGDTKTGAAWLEEFEIVGRIGRSTGTLKTPLLCNNARSMGGGALLDGSIVAIQDVKTKEFLYKHDTLLLPNLTKSIIDTDNDHPVSVGVVRKTGGPDIVARFKNELQADKYIAFMRGERMSK